MKKNKIIFEPTTKAGEIFMDTPVPATRTIPQWFKDQPLHSDGGMDSFKALKSGAFSTYKLCVPLTDLFTMGYVITLSADVAIINTANDGSYRPTAAFWVDWIPVDQRPAETLGNYPIPIGHSGSLFRWTTDWKVTTPDGYSLLATHPFNRYDLPFTTIGGVIDTDKHPNHLSIPFFLKDGFEGIIEKGTPIIQIIPIKREKWESERSIYDIDYPIKTVNSIRNKIFRSYKTQYWSKKEYK
jgi:hypothetical protein